MPLWSLPTSATTSSLQAPLEACSLTLPPRRAPRESTAPPGPPAACQRLLAACSLVGSLFSSALDHVDRYNDRRAPSSFIVRHVRLNVQRQEAPCFLFGCCLNV